MSEPRFRRRGWGAKFACAGRGVKRGVVGQSSFLVHLPVAAAVIAAGAWFRVSAVEWALLVLAIGLVLTSELLNAAIEALAPAVDEGENARIRDALDIAAGGVLVAALASVVVGLLVFGPRLWVLVAG
jgi:diacylglycerol kinase